MQKRNVIFTVAVLAVAAGLFVVQRLVLLHPGGGHARPAALLQYGDPMQELTIPLDEDKTYDIDTGFYTIHLNVQDGEIAFVDSPCPDHLCEGFGRLKAPGDWAACLPALASLSIIDPEEAAP